MQLKYKKRIPSAALWRLIWQVVMLACTISSAVLVYTSQPYFVAIVGAMSTAVSSWMAYEQLAIQTERYTSTVQATDSLLSWWCSLGDVEQASTVHIAKLVEMGEQILTRESLSLQRFTTSQSTGLGPAGEKQGAADGTEQRGDGERGRAHS